jgi:hypothetical protein
MSKVMKIPKRGNKYAGRDFIEKEVFQDKKDFKAIQPVELATVNDNIYMSYKIIMMGEPINKYSPRRQQQVGFVVVSEDPSGTFRTVMAELQDTAMDEADEKKL